MNLSDSDSLVAIARSWPVGVGPGGQPAFTTGLQSAGQFPWYVFLKTPLGMVTVSSKTGVKNAKVGQDMTVWIHDDNVAIDLYQPDTTVPLRRFLTGRLVYATPEKTAVTLWTPEGDKTFPTDHRGKGSLSSLKEGSSITVELDQQGTVVDIRRLN